MRVCVQRLKLVGVNVCCKEGIMLINTGVAVGTGGCR